MLSVDEFLLQEEMMVTGDSVQMIDKPLGRGKFAGADVFDVSDSVYCNCTKGKKRNERWDKFINDPNVSSEVRKTVRNTKRPVILRNAQTNMMTYVRR